MAQRKKPYEYDFEVNGKGYYQDTDCYCFEIDIATNTRKKIRDIKYDEAWNLRMHGPQVKAGALGKTVINISGQPIEVTIRVNDSGNLVIDGVGSVNYEMYDTELVLMKAEEI